MSERDDVLPVSALVGRTVLSLSTGNDLGTVSDVFLNAVDGRIVGFTVNSADGTNKQLPFTSVYSFGHDAIMANGEEALIPADASTFPGSPNVRELTGAKVISASGTLIGHIAGVYVATSSEPFVFYEVRESLLDTLLGRRRFIPASAGHALADDRSRLIIPDEAAETAATSVDELLTTTSAVRSFSPARGPNDTIVILPEPDEDETVVRTGYQDDETVVHVDDDADKTVRGWRRKG